MIVPTLLWQKMNLSLIPITIRVTVVKMKRWLVGLRLLVKMLAVYLSLLSIDGIKTMMKSNLVCP